MVSFKQLARNSKKAASCWHRFCALSGVVCRRRRRLNSSIYHMFVCQSLEYVCLSKFDYIFVKDLKKSSTFQTRSLINVAMVLLLIRILGFSPCGAGLVGIDSAGVRPIRISRGKIFQIHKLINHITIPFLSFRIKILTLFIILVGLVRFTLLVLPWADMILVIRIYVGIIIQPKMERDPLDVVATLIITLRHFTVDSHDMQPNVETRRQRPFAMAQNKELPRPQDVCREGVEILPIREAHVPVFEHAWLEPDEMVEMREPREIYGAIYDRTMPEDSPESRFLLGRASKINYENLQSIGELTGFSSLSSSYFG
jgi:hypothetical protein